MESVGTQLDRGKLLLAHFDSLRVRAHVQMSLNAEAGSGSSGSDEVEDDSVAYRLFTAPVLRDEGEQAVLDCVPLAGSGRQVANRDLQPVFVGQFL